MQQDHGTAIGQGTEQGMDAIAQEDFNKVQPVAEVENLWDSPARFINREFSWLQFNRRVLEETLNTDHPLLERLRFLSISAANLDEFFMVRVAGLEGQVRQKITVRTPDGKTPAEQLEDILKEIDNLQMEQQASLAVLQQYLAKEEIFIVRPAALSSGPYLAWHRIRGTYFPGADAAVHRPCAPVSLHSEPRLLHGPAARQRQRPRADDGAVASAHGARSLRSFAG